MAKLTLEQYLTYLGTESRTMGWGALLIYDRAKTNALLTQEYIERFDNNQYFPPYSATEETDQNAWSEMQDFILDKPRLSFTNSNIASSRARLSMKVVSGKYVTLNKPIGTRTADITSIALMDPLNAPSLHMDIRLEESNGGSIDEDGRVLLDLSRGESYSFHLSSSEDRNRKLGLALEQEFRSWDDSRKVFQLSSIISGDDDLQPHSFAVRTHSAARAGSSTINEEDDQEEGAVLIGVALKGMGNGLFPVNDKDLPYLLPELPPNQEPYSMNIILANQQWIANALGQALRRMEANPPIEVDYPTTPTGKVTGVTVKSGQIMPNGYFFDFPEPWNWFRGTRAYSLHRYEILPAPVSIGNNAISFEVINNTIHLKWGLSDTSQRVKFHIQKRGGGDDSKIYPAVVDFSLGVTYAFVILQEGPDKGKLRLQQTGSLEEHFETSMEAATGDYDVLNSWHDRFAPAWRNAMTETFNRFVDVITSAEVSINAMHLNHLLFRSQQAAEPRNVYTPGDLSLLGSLAPERLHFAVTPLEPVVAAGKMQPFSITPSGQEVTWHADNLPGESGETGQFTANGLYQAPPASSFNGESSRRILITARDGQKFSQALVSVTPSDISVYPHLQVAQYGGARYVLVGGDGNGEQLDWNMAPGSKGTLRRADPEGEDKDLDLPQGQDIMIYVSPDYDPGAPGGASEAVQLDQVVATNVSGNSRTIDLLVPWSNPTAWFELAVHEQGVELSMWVQGRNGPEKIEPEDAFWYLVKGSGTLNQNIYSPSDSANDYAIIAAIEDDRRLTYAYIVLPLPFIGLGKFKALRHAGNKRSHKP